MKLSKPRVFRDPVHDTISWKDEGDLGRIVTTLIDAPEFQRLRHVRQLGMAFMVFHGAEHSRFSHSIGVAHLARRMVATSSEVTTEEQRIAVVCAALLHDLGHAPFSHVMERIVGGHHESWSRAIVQTPGSRVHEVLSAVDASMPDRVARLIDGAGSEPGHHIISSQLDADRFDYLLRDSLATGVRVGTFDLERILVLLGEDAEGPWVDHRGWEAVESYLMARYHMYRLVYFHRAVRGAEAALQLLFRRVRKLLVTGRSDLVPDTAFGRLLRNESLTVAEWATLGDYDAWAVIRDWTRDDDRVLSLLARSLLHRNLLRCRDVDLSGENAAELDDDKVQAIRESLSSAERDLFFVDDTLHSPYNPWSAESAGASQAPIRLRSRDGRLRFIDDVSPITSALGQAKYRLRRWYFHDLIAPRVRDALA